MKKNTAAEVDAYILLLTVDFKKGKQPPLNKQLISNQEKDIIGEVSWYWKSQETQWMEIGIVIFDENYWGKNIGYKALSLWIDKLFSEKKDIVRLGLSTWSGNYAMIALAKKLGFQQEACYRKARIVNEEYFDSLSFGILREEWRLLQS